MPYRSSPRPGFCSVWSPRRTWSPPWLEVRWPLPRRSLSGTASSELEPGADSSGLEPFRPALAGDGDGAERVPEHRVAHRTEQHAGQATVAAGPDDEQPGGPGGVDQLARRRSLADLDPHVDVRVLLRPRPEAVLGGPQRLGPEPLHLLDHRVRRYRVRH